MSEDRRQNWHIRSDLDLLFIGTVSAAGTESEDGGT